MIGTGAFVADKLKAKAEELFRNAGGLVQQRDALAYSQKYSTSIGNLSEQQARDKYFELKRTNPNSPLFAELENIINYQAPAVIAPLEIEINNFRHNLAEVQRAKENPVKIVDTPLETIIVTAPEPIIAPELNTVQQTSEPITIEGSPTPSGNQTFTAKWEDYFASESANLPKFTAQYHEWEWK